jgi:predicted DCC family thiol-disulfide oxidoreductase YuxK
LARLDTQHRLRFAPLQGETGERLLQREVRENPAAVVWWRDGDATLGSDAVVEILRECGGLARVAGEVLDKVPQAIREAIYRWVAARRHSFLGTQACFLSDKKDPRFLP